MKRIEDERILSLENKLNSLMVRLLDLERRLGALERGAGVSQPGQPKAPKAPETGEKHAYLRRTIIKAKRDYEHKYR